MMSGTKELFLDLIDTYQQIENDLITNQEEVFLRYNYYTRKYRGNLLNDVNVGLTINEDHKPVAQIFLRNKTGHIKKHVVFNNEGNKIMGINTINYNING